MQESKHRKPLIMMAYKRGHRWSWHQCESIVRYGSREGRVIHRLDQGQVYGQGRDKGDIYIRPLCHFGMSVGRTGRGPGGCKGAGRAHESAHCMPICTCEGGRKREESSGCHTCYLPSSFSG